MYLFINKNKRSDICYKDKTANKPKQTSLFNLQRQNTDNLALKLQADILKAKWHKVAPHLSDKFYQGIISISNAVNCNPSDLLALMNSESGLGTKPNQGSARGLIQIVPSTAKLLNTTTDEIEKMTPEQQISLVKKCLLLEKEAAGFKPEDKLNGGQLYAINFLPNEYRKSKNGVLSVKGDKYYSSNAEHLDVNKDDKITVNDLAKLIKQYTPK